MPMIDVHAPAGLLPHERHDALAESLTHALLRWEGRDVAPPFSEHTAAFIHELPAESVRTAAAAQASVVRVTVLTPPGALDRAAQQGFVAEATELVADAAGDPDLAGRTWVLLQEAAEGGWGVAGFALGRAEFAALAGG